MQGSFSFPPARNGTNRPQPQRSTTSHKSSPYQRPGASFHSATTGSRHENVENSGKWQHDLFGSSSDLYQPSINVAHVSRIIPGSTTRAPASASLKPFGDQTPAPQKLIHPNHPPPATTTATPAGDGSESKDLMTRLGIKGSSNHQQQQREKERQREQRAEKVRLERERREQQRLRKELEKEWQAKQEIAALEDTGSVVQVEGLVYGTSAEDVQTAFGSYGEIKHCFIVDEKAAKEGDQLIARITFSRYDDAKTACHKLDGAIADGRPLHVRNVQRTPFPDALPPFAATPASTPAVSATVTTSASSTSSPALPVGPRAGNAVRGGGRSKMGPAIIAPTPAQVPVPSSIPSKMYADTIERVYQTPTSSVTATNNDIDSMDVEMDQVPISREPGRRGGRGTIAQNFPTQPPRPGVSLLDRIKTTNNQGAGSARADHRSGGPGSSNSMPSGPKSLAERLNPNGLATKGTKKKGSIGTGVNSRTTTGGGSLLARLK